MTSLDDDAMKNRPWTAVMIVAVLSRLVAINGAAALHLQSHPMSLSDEQQIERMYEMLDSHQKRAAAAAAASGPVQSSTRRDTRTDTDTDTENLPKFHYEVHHVAHKLGHRTPADVKLRDVSRHAATVTGDDDDDDDEEDRAPAAPAHHVTSGDTLQRSALVDSVGEYNQPVIGLGRGQNDDSSLLPADKKLDDEAEQQRTDLHVRDSTKDDYYEDYDQEASEAAGQSLARVAPRSSSNNSPSPISDVYFVAVVVGCSVAGLAGLLVAAVCWYRLHNKMKATSEVDYPAYGVTGPALPPNGKDSRGSGLTGDRKLAQSAQMYHYQHQKQQMIASERVSHEAAPHVDGRSDVESDDDDNEDGDYTVFECRGLATNGEMEVRNPLFSDQSTAMTDNASPPNK